ncbi:DNA polymerase III subunit epsilon [Roseospira marina]|uniref:DNA polymerase III subunit epsilon n=1 Tax=Roseospira marina TaxID=140057 RepID=A0A5M6IDC1_9PROT|nr:DNA polymerase III subunit epsilon [Roseospira marina]KAA5606243.1 DNA polymerase III subunit epsilon [Roseospira marina]MBB4314397.1 DNA polymerase-3 subunit epsilon [Roseospira marina]MBB5087557.1 DNA polymerase-3 subunit epsilon [Roseospira marina]
MTREIVLDTETTGFKPEEGDRVVEIGALELINHMPTGQTFHVYLNPDRDMPAEAERVHGLTEAFLADKPRFEDEAERMLAFFGDAPLVIHNAAFDMAFLNAELSRAGYPPLAMDRAIDTVQMARRKYPGAPASLDALCRRFGIENAHRTLHGALLDSELLAEVYLELIGGREPGLHLAGEGDGSGSDEDRSARPLIRTDRPYREPRPHSETEAERAAHAAFIATLKNPIWTRDEHG